MPSANWYFDFISPFAYLQLGRFDELPGDVSVTLKPVLFAGLLKHRGQLGPAVIPPKRTFVIDGQLFWGDDATDMVIDYLRNPALFDGEEMTRLSSMPMGATR